MQTMARSSEIQIETFKCHNSALQILVTLDHVCDRPRDPRTSKMLASFPPCMQGVQIYAPMSELPTTVRALFNGTKFADCIAIFLSPGLQSLLLQHSPFLIPSHVQKLLPPIKFSPYSGVSFLNSNWAFSSGPQTTTGFILLCILQATSTDYLSRKTLPAAQAYSAKFVS